MTTQCKTYEAALFSKICLGNLARAYSTTPAYAVTLKDTIKKEEYIGNFVYCLVIRGRALHYYKELVLLLS